MLAKLDDVDVVIAQEREDRFWCIGQRRWVPDLWAYDFENHAPLPGFADRPQELGMSVHVGYATADVDTPDAVRALPDRLDAARFPRTHAALASMDLNGSA